MHKEFYLWQFILSLFSLIIFPAWLK